MTAKTVSIDWHRADDGAALATKLAADVADALSLRIASSGAATLVVSGGSTPVPFFQALLLEKLDWQKIVVTLADERWVPADHNDSNEGLVRKHLLQGPAAVATLLPLYEPGTTAEQAQPLVHQRLISALGPDDQGAGAVVVLGMGGDGHTASLFPATDGLAAALSPDVASLCMAMHPPVVTQPRMSLTLAALIRHTSLFLHITGEDKRTVLESAIAAADPLDKPVVSLFQQAAPAVFWAP